MEKWKVIEGFEKYLVSNTGKILSLHGREPRLLRFGTVKGYHQVILVGECGKRKNGKVHRLVLKAFGPECPEGYVANHIDGDKLNNYITNLEWVSISQNTLHAIRLGLQKIGEDSSQTTRTDSMIRTLCEMISSGKKKRHILRDLPQISGACYKSVRMRRRWVHISKDYSW